MKKYKVTLAAEGGSAWQDRRIETREELEREVAAWEVEWNERGAEIRWSFTTVDARIKLRRLYPVL